MSEGLDEGLNQVQTDKTTGRRRLRPRSIVIIIAAIILLIIGTVIIRDLTREKNYPPEYMIKTQNYFDYQKKYECAGYAAAYVVRSLGEEADGLTMYNEIREKNSDGTVDMRVLEGYLQQKGYNASVYEGDMDLLKEKVALGIPVIAFVRVTKDLFMLHCLPVVGYDEDNIYAADSIKGFSNAQGETYYNRVISCSDFKQMLDIGGNSDDYFIVFEGK